MRTCIKETKIAESKLWDNADEYLFEATITCHIHITGRTHKPKERPLPIDEKWLLHRIKNPIQDITGFDVTIE